MIEVRGLGKSWARADGARDWLFRGLDLEVGKGESVVLMGPSGGGKSVLFKMIAGLLQADEGSLRVQGRYLGMLFQKNALFDSLTVLENLTFALKEANPEVSAEEARLRGSDWLKRVGLPGTGDLFPDELSGGMQKRLGIARALIADPDVILYDEPTAGLDPITSRMIADLLLELRRDRGVTTLTISNDVMRAYQLADRIVFLMNGRLLEGGAPTQVREARDPEIRRFVSGGAQ